MYPAHLCRSLMTPFDHSVTETERTERCTRMNQNAMFEHSAVIQRHVGIKGAIIADLAAWHDVYAAVDLASLANHNVGRDTNSRLNNSSTSDASCGIDVCCRVHAFEMRFGLRANFLNNRFEGNMGFVDYQ